MNFSKEFFDYQYSNLLRGKSEIAEYMKIIIYKTIPDFFELLDFDNDNIFLDPTLFAAIKSDNDSAIDSDLLKQLLWGSIIIGDRPKKINVIADKYGIIYLPKIGWITGKEKSKSHTLETTSNGYLLDGQSVNVEPIEQNNKLGIELLKHRLELFDDRFYDSSHKLIDYDVNGAFNRKSSIFNNALNFIAENVPWLAHLLVEGCAKAVVFNDGTHPVNDLFCLRNSFASFQIKRISFHNIYQPWYDEVFFLDDISHQMGHVIFDQIINNKRRFFKVNHDETIRPVSNYGRTIGSIERRSHEIVLHSLYTYFLILNVLDTALQNDRFIDEQKAEIKGRIAFYLRKSALDFELFESFDKNEVAETIYTTEGLYVYVGMKQSFISILNKYQALLDSYHLNNQTYNYNHKKFLEVNKFESVE